MTNEKDIIATFRPSDLPTFRLSDFQTFWLLHISASNNLWSSKSKKTISALRCGIFVLVALQFRLKQRPCPICWIHSDGPDLKSFRRADRSPAMFAFFWLKRLMIRSGFSVYRVFYTCLVLSIQLLSAVNFELIHSSTLLPFTKLLNQWTIKLNI